MDVHPSRRDFSKVGTIESVSSGGTGVQRPPVAARRTVDMERAATDKTKQTHP
jgi:hypothetical protein